MHSSKFEGSKILQNLLETKFRETTTNELQTKSYLHTIHTRKTKKKYNILPSWGNLLNVYKITHKLVETLIKGCFSLWKRWGKIKKNSGNLLRWQHFSIGKQQKLLPESSFNSVSLIVHFTCNWSRYALRNLRAWEKDVTSFKLP